MGARLAARGAVPKRRRIALEGKALGQAAAELGRRPAGEIDVVAVVFAGHQHVRGVVEVVVPLGGGALRAAVAAAAQVAGAVAVVLEDQVDLALTAGAGLHGGAQGLDDVRARVVADGVDGVQAQAVEVEFLQPVQGVVDEEIAHHLAARRIEVDGRAPRRVVRRVEEGQRVGMQVVAVRPEVVVDHVQQRHQAAGVGLLHQRLERRRRTVGAVRGERQHAVVAPAAASRKVRHRHQFHRRDAQVDQVVEPAPHAVEVAAGGEGTDVQFVDHRLVPGAPAPAGVLPVEGQRVDHQAGAVDVIRVAARGRVRHAQIAVDAVAVTAAGADAGSMGLIPAVGV